MHIQLLPLMSGAQRVSLDEFRYLKDQFKFSLVCSGPGPFPEKCEEIGVKVHFEPHLVRSITIFKDLICLYKLVTLIFSESPDLIHTHSSKPGFLGRLAAKIAGVSVVHTVHGYSFPAARHQFSRILFYIFEYLVARISDAIIVLNHSDFLITQQKLHVDPKKIFLIPNGVNEFILNEHPSDYHQLVEYKNFIKDKSKENFLIIGFIGRFERQKNPLLLIHSCNILINEYGLDLKLVFAGNGDLFPQMETLVSHFKLNNHIKILSWMNDISPILDSLDVFASTSLWEGMSLSILEAMSAKLPIVALDIPSNRDLIVDGVNGFLVDHDCDAALYADALRRCIVQFNKLGEMGQASYDLFNSKYVISHRQNSVNKIYRYFLGDDKQP